MTEMDEIARRLTRIETVVSAHGEGIAALNTRMLDRSGSCPHLPTLTRAANNMVMLAALDKGFDDLRLIVAEVRSMASDTQKQCRDNSKEITDIKLKMAGYAAAGGAASGLLVAVLQLLLKSFGVTL